MKKNAGVAFGCACVCYVNPQERKPQAQRDWLDLLQGRAHNVPKVDVCACSFVRLLKTPQAISGPAAFFAGRLRPRGNYFGLYSVILMSG